MRTRAFEFCAATGLMLCVTATAAAQQPKPAAPAAAPAQAVSTDMPTWELSAGYQLLHVPNQLFPLGVNVDAARHFGSVGLVAEAGWTYNSGNGGDVQAHVWNIGGGGRWTGFNSGRVWPFAQVLVGAEIVDAGGDIGGITAGSTETSLMVQPGAGVTFVGGDGWGIVGQVDYRRAFFDEPPAGVDSINNQFRVYVGARMILD